MSHIWDIQSRQNRRVKKFLAATEKGGKEGLRLAVCFLARLSQISTRYMVMPLISLG